MNRRLIWPSILNAASMLSFLGIVVLIYVSQFRPVSPLKSQRVLNIEAVQGHTSTHILMTHEFCTSRAGEAEAVRIFRRAPGQEGETDLVFETVPVRTRLEAGCDTRTRRVDLPDNFPAGRYFTDFGLRWCSTLGRCETDWLPPAVVVVGPVTGPNGANGEPGNRSIRVE